MIPISIPPETEKIVENGIRKVLSEFLFNISEKYEHIDFQTVCKKYLPPDNLNTIVNMDDLYSFSIRELQMLLASRGCKHLSGAKKTLICRLWKILHPYPQNITKIVNVPWNKKAHDPQKWSSVWATRHNHIGKSVPKGTPNSHLYKIDTFHEPNIVFFETNKEYIIEGTFDPLLKEIHFGSFPESLKQNY